MAIKHLDIKVLGEVQGVSFRYLVKQLADQLRLGGWIKNLPDGSVYIEVEGEEVQLQSLVDWCHHGPPGAQVKRVSVKEGQIKNFNQFTILSTS